MGKEFHLGDVLSVTTGHLLSPRGMLGLYEILDFMTADKLFMHQLPRAIRECKPYLLDQFPQLTGAQIDMAIEDLDKRVQSGKKDDAKQIVLGWLSEQVSLYGETHEVEPIPMDDHDVIDPIEELRKMVGDKPIITINVDDEGPISPYGDINWKIDDDN